jgi:anti-sigma factor RsiW
MNLDNTDSLHLADWIDRLQDEVDGSLAATETAQLHEHLAACEVCRGQFAQLLAMDKQLRADLPRNIAPSAQFDRKLFARIAEFESEQRTIARTRELQAHAARLAKIRGAWRSILRYQLGNIIAAVATVSAVVVALRASALSVWGAKAIGSDLANRLTRVENGLPLDAFHKLGISTTAALLIGGSLAVAGIAMWSASIGERRSR